MGHLYTMAGCQINHWATRYWGRESQQTRFPKQNDELNVFSWSKHVAYSTMGIPKSMAPQ